ncbi:MAG: sulfate permease [Candidatus Delongbacteria bacterium]|nr:sulfate permease [Candidatus Delongbacteria bacterium]MBN2835082.1 sulfate permease [Candidatus Delongbacteria bacterium]
MSSLVPKTFTVLKNYDRSQFGKDVISGLVVGIIAIPLSIALAISSGVGPEQGLYTAIVAGFIISFLGGSRVQVGGPTAAFVPIVYTILQDYGISGLQIATIMAGAFLIFMAVAKLGAIIRFIPYPIVTGFTSGIAISILVKQFKDFFGLTMEKTPAEFPELIHEYIKSIGTTNLQILGIGALSLIIMVLWKKYSPVKFSVIPGSLLAIIITTLIVQLFSMDEVITIGSKYNQLSSIIPVLTIPDLPDMHTFKMLLGPAISIALLAGIESLLSAVVADGMIGGHHRSNAELMAQGTANIASALLGGIPATGAIARTAANIKTGGRTPVAGMVHALSIFLIMLVLIDYAKMIPLTTLAAILIMVAYNMADWEVFRDIFKAPKSDMIVFFITFLLTVVFDMMIAIEIGMAMAILLFMKRMIEVTEVNLVNDSEIDDLAESNQRKLIKERFNDSVLLYEIRGPFFFGASDKFLRVNSNTKNNTKYIILEMKDVPAIDVTGLHYLTQLYKTCKSNDVKLLFCGIRTQPMKVLHRSGFVDHCGESSFYKTVDEAIEAI